MPSNLLYDGQYLDAESGLYYMRARYYDPTTTEFLTIDPWVAETMQPYSYANGDPIDQADPSGKWVRTAVLRVWDTAFWPFEGVAILNELDVTIAWHSYSGGRRVWIDGAWITTGRHTGPTGDWHLWWENAWWSGGCQGCSSRSVDAEAYFVYGGGIFGPQNFCQNRLFSRLNVYANGGVSCGYSYVSYNHWYSSPIPFHSQHYC